MIEVIRLKNKNGAELTISNFGASILALSVPDKRGKLINVVVGLASAEAYTKQAYQKYGLCIGASIGRYAGRISGKAISIEGENYPIYNTNGVHLHGGKEGFDQKYWTIDSINKLENPSIKLSYLSKDLEENYPGNLQISVTYELLESNALKITYTAVTDKTTVINLTNHAYFNLNGSGSILNHNLKIQSDSYLDVDSQLVPTGNIVPSKETRFDYNKSIQIDNDTFVGLDDTFVLNNTEAVTLASKDSGICMQVVTRQPAVVVFTPKTLPDFNYLNDTKFGQFPAICFETQNFPDAPNNDHFPTSILKPGQDYINESTFKFSIVADSVNS